MSLCENVGAIRRPGTCYHVIDLIHRGTAVGAHEEESLLALDSL